MKHLYSIVKNHEQVELTTSLRTAKEAARKVHAELVIEFDPIVTVEKQCVVPIRVYVYCQNIGIFETYTTEAFDASLYARYYKESPKTLVDNM